ncbi:unnamed protein product [Ophioblennius macclurei]
MSGAAGAAPPTAVLGLGLGLGLGLDAGAAWRQRSGRPAAAADAKTPVRLPSLVAAGARRRSGVARLSLSEPSLFTPQEGDPFEGVACSLRRSKPQAPLVSFSRSCALPSKTFPRPLTAHPHQNRGSVRPTFVHFSHGVQPGVRPRAARRHSHNATPSSERAPHGDLRPLALRYRNCPSEAESLSVVGKPCLLSSGQRGGAAAAAAGPSTGLARTQLHVFLPSETDGEEADSESVDEGFMDELDSKISTLKLHQAAVKAASYQA